MKYMDLWQERFELAKEYYKKNGNLLITSDYVVNKDGEKINLGMWINTQRKKYKSGKLSKERILLLEDIKMVWKFHNKYPLEENLENDVESKNLLKWNRMYNLAKEYYEKNGNLLIPHSYLVNFGGETYRLGNWVHNQRNFYKRGKLTQNKIKLLEDLGIKWSDVKRGVLDRKWLIMYKETLKYYNENGNLVIPNDYIVTINGIDYLLKKWIINQKNYLNSGKLSEDKKELFIKLINLSDIRCVYDLKFMKYYSLCKEYYIEHGDLHVPFNYEVIVNGEVIKLGWWINSQRMSYKRAKLSDEKIKMLEQLGMIWEVSSIREKEWIRKYELLKAYYDTNGDLFVPHNYTVEGANLDSWLLHQKSLYRNGKLSNERISKLREIGVYFGGSKSLKKK